MQFIFYNSVGLPVRRSSSPPFPSAPFAADNIHFMFGNNDARRTRSEREGGRESVEWNSVSSAAVASALSPETPTSCQKSHARHAPRFICSKFYLMHPDRHPYPSLPPSLHRVISAPFELNLIRVPLRRSQFPLTYTCPLFVRCAIVDSEWPFSYSRPHFAPPAGPTRRPFHLDFCV